MIPMPDRPQVDERRDRLNQLLERKQKAVDDLAEHFRELKGFPLNCLPHELEEHERLRKEVAEAATFYDSYKNHPSNQDLLPLDESLVEGEPKFGTRPNLPFPRRGH